MRRELHRIRKTSAAQLISDHAVELGIKDVERYLAQYSVGNREALISGAAYFASLPQALQGTISFCSFNGKDDPARRAGDITASGASVIIADSRLAHHIKLRNDQFVLLHEEPKIAFIRLLIAMSDAVTPRFMQIFPKDTYVGPNVVIEEGVVIGRNVELVGNIYIYANTRIGDNVLIKPGAVIGGEGYEQSPDKFGKLHLMPHLGGVIIKDNVMIGSCTCVDRGVFGDTVIKSGARIDNLVHIAHNVVVGHNSLVIANVMVGGSTIIGDNTRVAPSASLLNSIRIGDNCVVGMASAVLRDVPSNDVVYGVPAKSKAPTLPDPAKAKSLVMR